MTAVLADVGRLDLAVYRAIAATPTPTLDDPMRRISAAANHSKVWLGLAAAMATLGGRRGRRAAATGVASIAMTSAIVNLPAKFSFRRTRPDRLAAHVPELRHVQMPTSSSFPSGHAASGFAFAASVATIAPGWAAALRSLASVVGYSRVHTGVHYPGDVIVGALVGSTIGEGVGFLAGRLLRPSA